MVHIRVVACIGILSCAILAWTEPVLIESGVTQLFVDDYLIAEQEDLIRTLRQPVKEHGGLAPVIALPPDAFGGPGFTLQASGSIVRDPTLDQYVLFALAYSSEMSRDRAREWEKARLYRFTSRDGLNWSRGEWVFPRSADDLLDTSTGKRATNMDAFSCHYDASNNAYPYKGLTWFANWGEKAEGSYFMRSRDGLHWERGVQVFDGSAGTVDSSCRRIFQDGRELAGAGDVTLFTYDEQSKRYLGLVKFTSPVAVEHDSRLRSRAYVWMDRLDAPFDLDQIERVDLVPPAAAVNGDRPHDEYYASTAWRYGSLWLGGLKIWHGEDDYPHSAAGCAFMKLVSSRDGLHWKKVSFENEKGTPEVWLGNGVEGENNGQSDGGYITEFSTGPLRLGDDLVYYYGASSWGKNHPPGTRITGGGIFRARLRMDGFVSVDGGTLLTPPLSFTGHNLFINSSGPVQVEILGASDDVLGSAIVEDDALHHELRIEGMPLSSVAKDGVCQLRFRVSEGAHLYSFTIR